mmetsp:Transcript_36914/g.59725  ORF Transcript_36914/g.59725 Transcript_36914/m.59725 type:complete len:613 (+) Transcript_36914:81-1919(+)|eukprot:CAMPEP_0184665792 /NCGR_PEP_ID=MMETSP0308-20130426/58634_1 /TAXON_ID=38269 /ORGANISM="Gloeochaete witrockiana, Strain SAG 46.84" /LENGTH=612 /DNA_ID=CAMNT_0027109987 /DNA_START=56 /DNA_END=1894 /DNA_ORIENTATION=+
MANANIFQRLFQRSKDDADKSRPNLTIIPNNEARLEDVVIEPVNQQKNPNLFSRIFKRPANQDKDKEKRSDEDKTPVSPSVQPQSPPEQLSDARTQQSPQPYTPSTSYDGSDDSPVLQNQSQHFEEESSVGFIGTDVSGTVPPTVEQRSLAKVADKDTTSSSPSTMPSALRADQNNAISTPSEQHTNQRTDKPHQQPSSPQQQPSSPQSDQRDISVRRASHDRRLSLDRIPERAAFHENDSQKGGSYYRRRSSYDSSPDLDVLDNYSRFRGRRRTDESLHPGDDEWTSDVPGPGAYRISENLYKGPSMKIHERIPLPERKDKVPGPGAYDANYEKKRSPSVKIYRSHSVPHKSISDTPGPGAYQTNPARQLSATARSCFKSVSARFTYHFNSAPPPGQYNPDVAAISKHRMSGISTFGRDRSSHAEIQEALQRAPGPGTYRDEQRTISGKAHKQYKTGPSAVFRDTTPNRPSLSLAVTPALVGPGAYDVQTPKPKHENRSAVFMDPRSQHEVAPLTPVENPAPGQYDISAGMKASTKRVVAPSFKGSRRFSERDLRRDVSPAVGTYETQRHKSMGYSDGSRGLMGSGVSRYGKAARMETLRNTHLSRNTSAA